MGGLYGTFQGRGVKPRALFAAVTCVVAIAGHRCVSWLLTAAGLNVETTGTAAVFGTEAPWWIAVAVYCVIVGVIAVGTHSAWVRAGLAALIGTTAYLVVSGALLVAYPGASADEIFNGVGAVIVIECATGAVIPLLLAPMIGLAVARALRPTRPPSRTT